MISYSIRNRWTDAVIVTVEIDCDEGASERTKRALAVLAARKAYTDLRGADLRGADLGGADLGGADLRGTDLRGVDLVGANLRGVDLRGADLRGVDLVGVDLRDAKGAELAIARTRILPDGEIVGWKKCADNVIIKLRIPADAARSHAFGRKCRAAFADVVEVIGGDVGISKHDRRTQYRVGERVTPDSFDDNWMDECSHGIHFFITKSEAEAY